MIVPPARYFVPNEYRAFFAYLHRENAVYRHNMDSTKTLRNVVEAADYLSVSMTKVKRFVRDGQLRAIVLPDKSLLFDDECFAEFIERHRTPASEHITEGAGQ